MTLMHQILLLTVILGSLPVCFIKEKPTNIVHSVVLHNWRFDLPHIDNHGLKYIHQSNTAILAKVVAVCNNLARKNPHLTFLQVAARHKFNEEYFPVLFDLNGEWKLVGKTEIAWLLSNHVVEDFQRILDSVRASVSQVK